MSLIDLYVKDRQTGEIHRIGDNKHDMIHIQNGQLHYQNLQNGDGCTLGADWQGGYEFVDNTDDEGFNADPRKEKEGRMSDLIKCRECKFNRRDWTNPKNPDFYCGNEDSDNYGYNTAYNDGCEDGEVKE